MWNFVKVMSDNGDIVLAEDMFQTYDQLALDAKNVARATFTYVTKPDDAQVEKLKKLICRQYGKDGVELTLQEDPPWWAGLSSLWATACSTRAFVPPSSKCSVILQ